MMRSRGFATEEAKEQPELTEKEKELTTVVEKLSKEVETLTDKNKELDVSYLFIIFNFINELLSSRINTKGHLLTVKT